MPSGDIAAKLNEVRARCSRFEPQEADLGWLKISSLIRCTYSLKQLVCSFHTSPVESYIDKLNYITTSYMQTLSSCGGS